MKTSPAKAPSPAPLTHKQTFFKGCHYENMKGTYEVLSVEGNTMRIRWESGEECDTDVALQEKILDRIEREMLATKAPPKSRRDDEVQAPLAPASRGLAVCDFSQDPAKTTWRSRTGGIGELVAHELSASDLCFGFWMPFLEPMIFWADVSQETRSVSKIRAGFLCRLDEDRACYGFFVKGEDDADANSPWRRLQVWLGAPEHEQWLRDVVKASGLRVLDGLSSPGKPGYLEPAGAGWAWVEGDSREEVPSLAAFLELRLNQAGTLLACAATTARDGAVARGRRIGRDIAQLFEALMPVYRVCLGLPERPAPSAQPRKARGETTCPAGPTALARREAARLNRSTR